MCRQPPAPSTYKPSTSSINVPHNFPSTIDFCACFPFSRPRSLVVSCYKSPLPLSYHHHDVLHSTPPFTEVPARLGLGPLVSPGPRLPRLLSLPRLSLPSSFCYGDNPRQLDLLSDNSTPPTWLTQSVVRLPQDPSRVLFLPCVRSS